jgi:hypothetical protein
MKVRQVIGALLMVMCIAGLVAWNLHPPEGDDTNLLVRSVVMALTGGGAFLAWSFLVRTNRA